MSSRLNASYNSAYREILATVGGSASGFDTTNNSKRTERRGLGLYFRLYVYA
jgi:hypothetical protein